jgi:hypothetical protein
LREEHFALLRDAIAGCGGKEVKNTGDGLMIAFTSASAAVKCAVAMQQLFERRYRNSEQSLFVRIGLGAGESTVKGGDYFGMPSIEAGRLCAQAPSGGILVSGLAKTLAGRCEGVDFISAGGLELKGFPEPLEAFSVSWTPLGEEASGVGAWPLPALLRSVPAASPTLDVSRSALGSRRRWCSRATAHAKWSCFRVNRGSARRDSRALQRTARTPRASRCAWARVLRSSRCRMSRGSRSVRR